MHLRVGTVLTLTASLLCQNIDMKGPSEESENKNTISHILPQ